MKTNYQIEKALNDLKPFIGHSQRKCIGELCLSEEKEWFRDKLCELAETVRTMAKTYEQDDKGKDAIVYLHYFTPSNDCWITEKDMGDEQIQAFGYASVNGCEPEAGYISIQEWLENGAELDLHFTPKPVREAKTLNDNAEMCVSVGNTIDNSDDY